MLEKNKSKQSLSIVDSKEFKGWKKYEQVLFPIFYAIHSINYYVTRWSIDTLTQYECDNCDILSSLIF
jgi:hypothetical protein